MRLIPLLVVGGLLASPSFAVSQAPQAPPTVINPTTGTEMTTYYMVLLRRGPAWTANVTPESAAVSKGHMENIQKLTAAGKMVVAGPFLEQSGAQALAGLFILRVASLDEAKATVSTDPAVKAGRFTYEIIPWLGPTTLKY
jgi:uncharacterized protein YciI